ncbi:MAG: LysM peptidoglycan-binding domain-containing protein [Rhodobacteraceae bacterium]|nr:LysM peptidoglycan-binding domain-containing protein [Paracoccaceae bacterium]
MAAIPYLWYWIVGGLVAVLIATVAIFSERINPDLVGNKTISSEIEDASGTDQQNDIVPEQANTHDKIENILENKETEVVLEQKNDETVSEEKINIDPPKLETVRIDDDGTALVAGIAYPGSILEILVDEKVVESITLGKDGNFAVIFDIELKDQPQVISLKSIDGEIILVSDETMIVAPKIVDVAQADRADKQIQKQSIGADNSTDAANSQQATSQTTSDENSASDLSAKTALIDEVEKGDDIDKAPDNAVVKADVINKTPQLAQPTEEKIEKEVQKILTTEPSSSEIASSGAEKPTILLADNEGVKVVQGRVGPTVMTDVLFDTINYSKDGGVAVTGRGSPDSIVRFYLDNSPVTSTAVDQTGYWSADLSDVEAGVYTLRLDQLDQSGKVSSRIESPFKREDRNVLADQMKDIASPARINVITVQPGNTLWAISRERYGRGILYVQVFDANKDKIRNPDLIYPGQIFDLPDDIRVN